MASGTWNVDASGNWSLATNWLSNVIADGAGSSANFTNNISADRTVTLDTSRTIGAIVLADSTATFYNWDLNSSGGSILTLDDGAGGSPVITVNGDIGYINLVMAGSNGYTKSGSLNLVLTNNNTVTGTINVNTASLIAGNNTTAGSFGAEGANIAIATGATASVNRSNAYTISGNITGTGTFSKVTGTGTLTLSGGTISVSTMTLSAGTTDFLTTGTQTVSSAIGGAGAITKSAGSTGTTTFSTAGTNTGAWTINAGTLNVTAAQTATAGTITVASGATLTSSAAISKPLTISAGSTGNSVVRAGSTATTVNGQATLSGTTSTLVVGAGGIADCNTLNVGTATLNGDTTFRGASTPTVVSSPTQILSASGANYLRIQGTSTVTFPDALIYANAAGSSIIYHDSGTASLTGGFGSRGITLNPGASGYAYYGMTAGSISSTSDYLFSVAGGSVFSMTGTAAMPAGGSTLSNVTIASTNNRPALADMASSGAKSIVGLKVTAGTSGHSVLNIRNGATLTVTRVATFNNASTGGLAAVNVMSGSTLTMGIYSPTLVGSGPHEGVRLISDATLSFTGVTDYSGMPITIYGSGAKISGATSVLSLPIGQESGYGVVVTGAGILSAGSGYKGPPAVKISSTSVTGRGATARAIWDSATETVTGIEITCPGSGYASADSITVTLDGPSVSNFGCSAVATVDPSAFSLALNNVASQAFEKTTTGILSLAALDAAPNTFTGSVLITDGTLSIGNGGAAGTLGLNDASAVSIASAKTLNFNRSDSRTYTGVIAGAGNITKTTSGGTAILDADNTFTGTVTATTGALRAVRAASFGAGASSLTTASGGAIELAGGITINRNVNLVGSGAALTGAINNVSGNNTITGTVAFTTGTHIGSTSDTLTFSNTGTVSVPAGTLTFSNGGVVDFSPVLALTTGGVTRMLGSGVAILRGTNTYTGVNTITAGYLGYVGSIAPSVAGNFGNSALAANILIAASAGVRYYGSGAAAFSRPYTFQGGAGTINYLESNGVGDVTHSVAPTYATANVTKTLGLGGTGTAANTISYVIANNGTGAVSLTKAGTGKWVASQNNTATGAYAVNAGTLILQGTNTPTSVAVSNSGTVLGLEIATWSAGTRRVGTAPVTVNANAKIQTFNGTGAAPQNGRHTYTNLTFAANGRIRIGG